MSNGATKDYAFGNKNQWRRWLWNRISERCDDRHNALVLFLAGREALDVEVAVRHGFQRKNMIAIERNPVLVQELRAQRINTVSGDLLDVVKDFPPHRPVGVLLADFCAGLSDEIARAIVMLLYQRAFADCVIACNLLRGREARGGFATKLRTALRSADYSEEEQKHRGMQICEAFLYHVLKDNGTDRRLAQLQEISRPVVNSYRSIEARQTFDSAVWRSPIGRFSSAPAIQAVFRAREDAHVQDRNVRLRIGAALAHQTRGTYADRA